MTGSTHFYQVAPASIPPNLNSSQGKKLNTPTPSPLWAPLFVIHVAVTQ